MTAGGDEWAEATEILTPGRVERAIMETLRMQTAALDTMSEIADEAAEAEVSYKVRFSQERLKSKLDQHDHKKTDKEAEDEATIATEAFLRQRLISANRLTTQREVCNSIRERLATLRSLAANVRQLT